MKWKQLSSKFFVSHHKKKTTHPSDYRILSAFQVSWKTTETLWFERRNVEYVGKCIKTQLSDFSMSCLKNPSFSRKEYCLKTTIQHEFNGNWENDSKKTFSIDLFIVEWANVMLKKTECWWNDFPSIRETY